MVGEENPSILSHWLPAHENQYFLFIQKRLIEQLEIILQSQWEFIYLLDTKIWTLSRVELRETAINIPVIQIFWLVAGANWLAIEWTQQMFGMRQFELKFIKEILQTSNKLVLIRRLFRFDN